LGAGAVVLCPSLLFLFHLFGARENRRDPGLPQYVNTK
jgi:hypothetical protein